MSYTRSENAHAVLLPATFPTPTSMAHADTIKQFLNAGGRSVLFGFGSFESDHGVLPERRKNETLDVWREAAREARRLAGDDVLVVVDQELAGLERMHDIVPKQPAKDQLASVDIQEFENFAIETGKAASRAGVNLFLSPVLDLVSRDSAWLTDRTWSESPEDVANVSAAYIRGLQAAGVAATAKHFPGISKLNAHPDSAEARESSTAEELETNFLPFKRAIKDGVEAVMLGAPIVQALDPVNPAPLSPTIIGMLRNRFEFDGLIISDNIDIDSTLLGRTVDETVVRAIAAGVDLVLLVDTGDRVESAAKAIEAAVENGTLEEGKLVAAANRVRALAKKYPRNLS